MRNAQMRTLGEKTAATYCAVLMVYCSFSFIRTLTKGTNTGCFFSFSLLVCSFIRLFVTEAYYNQVRSVL